MHKPVASALIVDPSVSRIPADYDPNRLWVRFLARSLSPEAPAPPEAIMHAGDG